MSATVLNNLLEYLLGALSADERQWLSAHLVDNLPISREGPIADEVLNPCMREELAIKHHRPYTIEELNARIDASEAEAASGAATPFDDFMLELETEFAQEDIKTVDMLEAVS